MPSFSDISAVLQLFYPAEISFDLNIPLLVYVKQFFLTNYEGFLERIN